MIFAADEGRFGPMKTRQAAPCPADDPHDEKKAHGLRSDGTIAA